MGTIDMSKSIGGGNFIAVLSFGDRDPDDDDALLLQLLPLLSFLLAHALKFILPFMFVPISMRLLTLLRRPWFLGGAFLVSVGNEDKRDLRTVTAEGDM